MNSRFRPYRIILPRQGGSINIIQVTVYSFTVPALKLMNVKFCLFLATTAHCHDRAAIKIHITTFNRINLHVRCGNLHNFNCFWLSIYLYIISKCVQVTIYRCSKKKSNFTWKFYWRILRISTYLETCPRAYILVL